MSLRVSGTMVARVDGFRWTGAALRDGGLMSLMPCGCPQLQARGQSRTALGMDPKLGWAAALGLSSRARAVGPSQAREFWQEGPVLIGTSSEGVLRQNVCWCAQHHAGSPG